MNKTLDIINHPAGWKSQGLYQNTSLWQYRINEEEVKEIDNALKHLKACAPVDYVIDPSSFPLNHLKNKLNEISDFVENNYGIFLLRGIPVNKYSHSDLKLIYAGLGSYWGTPVAQSMQGELIGDVIDTGKSLTDKSGRGTVTKDPLPFHTDRCDVVTLLCLHQCKIGGKSRVVSAVAIYNEIARTRPDLIELLEEPYFHARAAWETNGENTFYSLPIFSRYKGNFVTRYLRHFTNMAQNIPGVPKMTEKQIEALDLIEKLANDSEFCADMDFEPGDIQILNSFVSLHSREGYEDDEETKRYLLRLWLSAPNSRPLPPSFAPLYGKVNAGEIRGGVPINKTTEEKL